MRTIIRLYALIAAFLMIAGLGTAFASFPSPDVIEISSFSDIEIIPVDMQYDGGAGGMCLGMRPESTILLGLDLSSYAENPHAADAVEKNINVLSVRMKKNFSVWLVRSEMYLELMKGILREEGVPEEMAYLPLIESGFNPKAYSHMKAAGFWQFIAGTAKRYGLKINSYVDERRDPVKSTRAAARYLKDLHDMFGSWSLAMAAYNAGEMKIKRALNKSQDADFWDIAGTKLIKRETKNYVPLFIAASLIAENPEGYGFYDLDYLPNFRFDEVILKSPVTLRMIADYAGATVAIIKELNPELKGSSTPPVSRYAVRLPQGSGDVFLKSLSEGPSPGSYRLYTVRQGDTVWGISKKTGVSANDILALNKLPKKAHLRVGQKLMLPAVQKGNNNNS